MEEWEFELEFLTWDAAEKAASGNNFHVEEYEVDNETFQDDLIELSGNKNDWEDITYDAKK